MDKQTEVQIAIIGAGFAGLGMGIRLRQAGITDFVIFERAEELGGTWRDNVYPGCACDIPSLVYSYSFAQNPNWSRKFPTQPEILAYLKACAKQFKMHQHIRFGTEVEGLRFDEANGRWHIRTQHGQSITAQIVVSAMGPLNRPNIPNIAGLTQFAGQQFHSSEWDITFEPRGKRIAVIGTGASAIQFIPQVAQEAEQVLVFQRTAPWVMPRNDEPVPAKRQKLFQRAPSLQKLARSWLYWMLEVQVFNFLGLGVMNKLAERLARKHIEEAIHDPLLRQQVTPHYRIGCKRILLSDDYYPALQRSNVSLLTSGVQAVGAHTVTDGDGVAHDVDAIIFGTGFVASEFLIDMTVHGCDGRELLSEWRADAPSAYFGLSVSGYPNLFFLLGPNTGLGHNSVLLMIEAQYNYILDYLAWLKEKDVPYLDLKPEVQAEHVQQVQADLAQTVWQSGGCASWYQTRTGRNSTLWPGSTAVYHLKTRHVHKDAYD